LLKNNIFSEAINFDSFKIGTYFSGIYFEVRPPFRGRPPFRLNIIFPLLSSSFGQE
jgi:hypothetical protein